MTKIIVIFIEKYLDDYKNSHIFAIGLIIQASGVG